MLVVCEKESQEHMFKKAAVSDLAKPKTHSAVLDRST